MAHINVNEQMKRCESRTFLKVIALLPYPKTGILGDVQGGMLHWNHLSLQYKILITITAA